MKRDAENMLNAYINLFYIITYLNMIKNLIIDNVRWISKVFDFWRINVIRWRNGSGKSTISKLIFDLYKWKSDIKEGAVTIIDDDWYEISSNKGTVHNSPNVWVELFLSQVSSFMKKEVAWLNKTKEDKRKLISEVLWINREKFFADNNCKDDISWLRKELNQRKISSNTLLKELIEKENQLNSLDKVKKVELVQSNVTELTNLKNQLSSKKLTIDNLKNLISNLEAEKPKEEVKEEVKVCPTCWTKLTKPIIVTKPVTDNSEVIKIRKEDLAKAEDEAKLLEDKINSFKVVEWNDEEYRKYIQFKNTQEYLKKDIKELKDKIKSLETVSLEMEIQRYKDINLLFIQDCENKLRLNDDISFIFYRKLKSPNAEWEEYTSDFDIEYKWRVYSELSSWEQVYVDILISKMFIDYYWLVDFIVIDNAEISDENLKKIIVEELQWFQVFITRISNTDLEVEVR